VIEREGEKAEKKDVAQRRLKINPFDGLYHNTDTGKPEFHNGGVVEGANNHVQKKSRDDDDKEEIKEKVEKKLKAEKERKEKKE